MDRLVDLIKIYDHDLGDEICDYLVCHFEKSSSRHKRILRNKNPNFTEYNFSRHAKRKDKTKKIFNFLTNKIHDHARPYFNYVNKNFDHLYPDDHSYSHTVFPNKYGVQRIRIKRYLTGMNEGFNTHVDVMKLISCPRFLSFLWYLNDVDEGGSTIFDNLKIKPKKGRLVIFPPMWMFPHMGEEPVSNTKYVMSSYLSYNNIFNSFWRL